MGYKTEKKIPSIILSVFIVLLILVGTIVPAYAAPTQDMMVTDSGEMLSDREEQEVSEMLYSINRQTGIEYLVYTIKSLNGEDIETCANRLFRTAGLGDKEKDNGLLLLISYDDRKFRLEVGYGLEGDIPDTQAANIINTMTPYFKEGNYGDGVKAAVKQTAVILNSSGEYTISEDWAAQAQRKPPGFKRERKHQSCCAKHRVLWSGFLVETPCHRSSHDEGPQSPSH